jgi:hypothetical protein
MVRTRLRNIFALLLTTSLPFLGSFWPGGVFLFTALLSLTSSLVLLLTVIRPAFAVQHPKLYGYAYLCATVAVLCWICVFWMVVLLPSD